MRVADFEYHLPEALIAQEPLARRDASRLMVLARDGSPPSHRRFSDLPDLLRPGDLLVLNDTRVLPARLMGRRIVTGAPGASAKVEALLVEKVGQAPRGGERWRAMLKGSGRPGDTVQFGEAVQGRIEGRDVDGLTRIDLTGPGDLAAALERAGRMPTPPYIRRRRDPAGEDAQESVDRDRYQTVYAREPGALAAPTAGLHFTPELLAQARARGVEVEALTLHVGLGTFLPVRSELVEEHRLHPEPFIVPEAVAKGVERARGKGGRVVAVGTTVARALEASAGPGGEVRASAGWCELFIVPGYRFRVVDSLVTNFHLPRSTLLMLVSALAGRERILGAYAEAVRLGYRFYSYGDAMLLE